MGYLPGELADYFAWLRSICYYLASDVCEERPSRCHVMAVAAIRHVDANGALTKLTKGEVAELAGIKRSSVGKVEAYLERHGYMQAVHVNPGNVIEYRLTVPVRQSANPQKGPSNAT